VVTYAEAADMTGTLRICTNPATDGFLDNRLAEGTPVRANDFSQS
jgi:hypothetical protein